MVANEQRKQTEMQSAIAKSYSRLRHGFAAINRRFCRILTGSRIIDGPFKGLRYTKNAGCSVYPAKLLGTYELELKDIILKIPSLPVKRVIDIGAAEGYYAVGLACMMKLDVVAFELDSHARGWLCEMVELNDVQSRLRVLGGCDPEQLGEVLAETNGNGSLIICDVEGFEEVLLDPSAVRGLDKSWILVETHEFLRAGIVQRLCSRFGSTHRISKIETRTRHLEDFPKNHNPLTLVPPWLRLRYMNERRPGPMTWLWMEPMDP